MENTHIKTEETTSVTSNSETATVAASTDNTTVTSSDNVNSTGFQPFEQLHEAVLAAVNSHGMPPGFMAAAAAAAAELVSNNHNNDGDQPMLDMPPPLSQVDYVKKENIRASNRERKKKWRIHNEERNKDNDLRCRVNKRANKLYGTGDSPAKAQWIQEEFEKRRQKRMDKERRKHIVNNVLSVPGNDTSVVMNNGSNVSSSSVMGANTNAVTTSTHSTPTTTTTTTNNTMGGEQINYYTPLPQIDTDTADKLLNFPTDLQRQLLEQLNNSMLALANGMQTTNPTQNEEEVQAIAQGLSSNNSTTSSEHNSPLVTVPLPPPTTTTSTTTTSPPTTTTTTTTTTTITSPTTSTNNNNEIMTDDSKEKKKPEYPMDAVLTLMQLNAGWRQ
ncbi:hypothetical protein BD770DRAFT_430565 [Pilaira anomala]|nr:hypothetical protein BD770DRAFT_430565 [Pilaira anomala]